VPEEIINSKKVSSAPKAKKVYQIGWKNLCSVLSHTEHTVIYDVGESAAPVSKVPWIQILKASAKRWQKRSLTFSSCSNVWTPIECLVRKVTLQLQMTLNGLREVISEKRTLYNHNCENLKSCAQLYFMKGIEVGHFFPGHFQKFLFFFNTEFITQIEFITTEMIGLPSSIFPRILVWGSH
jgi:hypothetical protein